MKINVLDHGHVELVNHMGNDREVAEAAWVSTDSCSNRSDSDVERVIRFLARENHWTPFGQVNIKLRIKWPIFVARQAMRSNIGIVWNEESRRYVSHMPDIFLPEVWRDKGKGIKQGSGEGFVSIDPTHHKEYMEKIVMYYNRLLDSNVAPEMARMVLPQCMYTECIGNFTLAALARFHNLRVDSHAQKEIQDYGHAIGEIARSLFPVSWEALTCGSS